MTTRNRATWLLTSIGLVGVGWAAGLCNASTQAQGNSAPAEDASEPLGKRSTIQMEGQRSEWIRIASGAEVHEQPSRSSNVFDIVAEPTDFEVLERQSSWVRVLYRGWLGWILVGGGHDGADRGPPIRYTPDEKRLLRARSILRDGIEPRRLGPFELFTDVDDEPLLRRLSAVATQLPDAYRRRFGLDPGSDASEVVVIFANHHDYVRFESGEPAIAGTGTRGYSGRGISVLSVGDREVESTIEILVHELTHILNRRVLGMNSPAWVEEGLADDLAYSKVSSDGDLRLGTLGGHTSRGLSGDISGRYRIDFEITGGRSMLTNLLARWGDERRPSLVELLDMPWVEFVQPEVRPLHYAQSAFFVRFLLGSKNENHSRALSEYLQALAISKMPQGESLWEFLDEDSASIETAYYRWLHRTAAANGL